MKNNRKHKTKIGSSQENDVNNVTIVVYCREERKKESRYVVGLFVIYFFNIHFYASLTNMNVDNEIV